VETPQAGGYRPGGFRHWKFVEIMGCRKIDKGFQ
jgi:hypothetical protein